MDKSPQDQVSLAAPLLDVVGLFEQLSIGYALIGGVASMFYGRSRFTEDVNFVTTESHCDVVASTLRLYHDTGVEIDIWKDEHADDIVRRAHEVTLAGHLVRIADPHDLIAMKLRAGRIQDDYDVSEILKGTPIDDAVIQSRVTPEQFQHYQAIKQRA